jgi:hypothetical protein
MLGITTPALLQSLAASRGPIRSVCWVQRASSTGVVCCVHINMCRRALANPEVRPSQPNAYESTRFTPGIHAHVHVAVCLQVCGLPHKHGGQHTLAAPEGLYRRVCRARAVQRRIMTARRSSSVALCQSDPEADATLPLAPDKLLGRYDIAWLQARFSSHLRHVLCRFGVLSVRHVHGAHRTVLPVVRIACFGTV